MDRPLGFSNHLRAHFEQALKPARRVNPRERGGIHLSLCAGRDHMLGARPIPSIRSRHKDPLSCIASGKSVVAVC